VTLFGESDADRFNRLLKCEESRASDMKKADRDETSKSFIPDDHEVELLKFMKEQEKLLEAEKKLGDAAFEEIKDEGDDDVEMKVHKDASDQVDNYIGRYKTADDLKIGDRKLDNLVEVKEKNQQFFRNFRKFETQCKKHPVDEKSRLIYIWCKKMLKAWEDELVMRDTEYLKSAQGKQDLGIQKQCEKYVKPLLKLLKKKDCNTEILDGLYLLV
jgi:hypothetical protein